MNIKSSWYLLLNKYINDILKQLEIQENKLIEEKNNIEIFPKRENIFRCLNYFEFNETRVVILGQDPYHGKNQATGLCFGVNTRPPPSLKNIAKELKNDLNINLNDYTLEKWAKQKILLLNSALTVLENKPGSHIKLWHKFTDTIVNKLNENNNSIIFVAWGAFAYNKLKFINTEKHSLIVSSHPSPLSVYKKFKEFPAFDGSNPFSKINNILLEKGLDEIVW